MTANDNPVGAGAVDLADVVVARSPWRTTLVASFGLFAVYVPVTAVITALPSIQRGLSASASSLQWVSDALVIPMAALTRGRQSRVVRRADQRVCCVAGVRDVARVAVERAWDSR